MNLKINSISSSHESHGLSGTSKALRALPPEHGCIAAIRLPNHLQPILPQPGLTLNQLRNLRKITW